MKPDLQVHILERLDKLQEDVSFIRVDQSEIKADLRYHIKRTDILEAEVKSTKKEVSWLVWPVTFIRSLLRLARILK